jgi:hypothetical protein
VRVRRRPKARPSRRVRLSNPTALALALLVSGCSAPPQDVVSLETPAGSESPELKQAAQSMRDCLIGAGLPAELTEGPNGAGTMVGFAETVGVAWRFPGFIGC